MAVIVGVLNGTNLNRDAQFQSEVDTILNEGVRKNFDNELEVTLNQVDTGMAFVQITRDNVSPSEVFIVPIRVTAATVVDTTGTGWVILRLDKTKILDGSSNAVDGSGVATVEDVTVLPTTDPYIILAVLTGGSIADAREWTQLSENVIDDPIYYDEDAEASDAYAITIVGVKEYIDGQQFAFKANTLNVGASTLKVNSLGAKALKKLYNVDTQNGDIPAGAIVEVRYDADNDWFQIMNTPATTLSLSKATQSQAEAATDDTTYMTPLKVSQAENPRVTIGENIDGTTTPQACHFSDGTGGRTASRLYKSDNNDTANAAAKFDGFVVGVETTGNLLQIYARDGAIVPGFTGLTEGKLYYVDNTPGAITLTKRAVLVGLAVSTTEIMIIKDSPVKVGTDNWAVTGNGQTKVITHNLGRIPKKIGLAYGGNGGSLLYGGHSVFANAIHANIYRQLDNASNQEIIAQVEATAMRIGEVAGLSLLTAWTATISASDETTFTMTSANYASNATAVFVWEVE